jgi:lambda family phage tail tape measure protein
MAQISAAAPKPVLNYQGTPKSVGGGKKDNSAAQEAKAQLAADLSDIKAAQDAIINTYTNAGRILEAERSAGLKDEQEYYAEKKRLLLASNDAEQVSLQKQIDRLQQENLTGKDAIENNRKIAEGQAKLTKAREDATTAVQVLAIQEESSYKKIAGALLAARQAAQDYYDTTNKGYERMLAGLGGGNKNRDQLAAIQQIEDRYQQQRQDLANRRSQAELQSGGALTAAQAKQYDDQLAIINEFQAKALGSYQSYYAKLNEAQKDWSVGALEALHNYADEASNTAKLTEDAFTHALGGLEDAFTDFFTTGKADWKSFADSVIKDITRIIVKQQITGPLANMLSGGSGSGGGLLGSLFGSGGGASAGGGDALGALIKLNGWASGGFTGFGNPAEPAGIVHKGEWVIPADQVQKIGVNNLAAGKMGGGLTVNYLVPGRIDTQTQTQLAQKTRRESLTVANRF